MIEFSAKTRVPVKMWVPDYELDAMAVEQVINVANHPEVSDHVALMPDAHGGFGVPIGCVFPTEGVVIPNAVGVDIGCGMQAVRTSIDFDPGMGQHFWDAWASEVNERIPTGFEAHRTADPAREHHWLFEMSLRADALQDTMLRKGPAQLGTLGGGNHFLEAQVDEEDAIWLMVHSGSRGTGNQLARYYHTLAVAETEKRGVKVAKDLASLSFDEQAAHDYMHDMNWGMAFARESRMWMIEQLVRALEAAIGIPVDRIDTFDCMHNYAEFDGPEDHGIVLHRKGATDAGASSIGIIPGSMGSTSYIVHGKGNLDSYASCSHGAGRKMGRNVAKKTFDVDLVNIELEDAATFTTITKGQLDEAPGAYKDIATVIGRQRDLIDIVHTLRPLRTVKGDSRAKDD